MQKNLQITDVTFRICFSRQFHIVGFFSLQPTQTVEVCIIYNMIQLQHAASAIKLNTGAVQIKKGLILMFCSAETFETVFLILRSKINIHQTV